MSAISHAGPDTNGAGAGLLEQLPHGLAGGLPRRPAAPTALVGQQH